MFGLFDAKCAHRARFAQNWIILPLLKSLGWPPGGIFLHNGGEIIKFTQNIRDRDLSAVYVALCAPSGGGCFISRRPLLHNFKESTEREGERRGGYNYSSPRKLFCALYFCGWEILDKCCQHETNLSVILCAFWHGGTKSC